jgi:uncharacterized protein (DUF302 family)
MAPKRSEGVARIVSGVGFDETLAAIAASFKEHGIRVFARIDQAAAAADENLSMPPTVLIVAGSPAAGTPVMLANPDVGIDLPLKVLVREDRNGRVSVTLNRTSFLADRHHLRPDLVAALEGFERLVLATLRSTRSAGTDTSSGTAP